MPPKAKFTKSEITAAALEMVRTEGFESLTARALGKKLGSSSCPIFTVFENMEEVQREVMKAAKSIYKGYVEKGLSEDIAFKGVGTQYIMFAINEPKLFQLLFMSENKEKPVVDNVLPLIEESYDKILASITGAYGLTVSDAEKLYKHLWVYTHGIAALCATKTCLFTAEEISNMLTEVFICLLKMIKGAK